MYLSRDGLWSENETIDNTITIIISNRDYSRNYNHVINSVLPKF